MRDRRPLSHAGAKERMCVVKDFFTSGGCKEPGPRWGRAANFHPQIIPSCCRSPEPAGTPWGQICPFESAD